MNENIDLTQILKDAPKGTIFYCAIFGNVIIKIRDFDRNYPIAVYGKYPYDESPSILCVLSKNGKYNINLDGECILFPSKDQRDWNKFTAPWHKKENE